MNPDLGPEELQPRPWIARLLGVVPSSTHAMDLPVAEGGGRGKPALFLPSAVHAHRLKQIEAKYAGRGDLDPVQERAKRDRSQAALADQLRRRREGEVLEASDVARTWSNIVLAIRARLLALPQALADRCAQETNPAVVQEILRAGVYDTLRELAGSELPADPEPAPAFTPRRKRSAR
jgi:phage terminase Nu1 subunit (DNA packaging protein)